MPNPYNAPRFGLGLTEERLAAQRQENRQKQELYAQQKKIQFSNLLERSSQDVDAYVESQNNVFLSGGGERNAQRDGATSGDDQNVVANTASESVDDDRDGVDFFMERAFKPTRDFSGGARGAAQDDLAFDPAATPLPSLRERLLEQLELDGKYESLDPSVKEYARKIIDELDPRGFFIARELADRRDAQNDPEEVSRAIVEYDSLFDSLSTKESRERAKRALDDSYDRDSKSKNARRLAKEEFDAIVGRKTTKEEREIARKLLETIDPQESTGDPFELILPEKPSPEERAKAQEALRVVQSLDPPGVGARDLRESLLLRLNPNSEFAPRLRMLLSEHFDDFMKKRIVALSSATGLSQDEIAQIYDSPFPFSPAPEQLFPAARERAEWIQPEVVVECVEGRWRVKLDESKENVELDPYYRKLLFSKRVDKKTKEYLRRQLVEAQALLDALRNRNSTLLRVAKALVDFQNDFFDNPKSFPKPLTQQQIADKLGLDASTVSRACNDKWMATPRGFVAFKDLLPKAVSGDATSGAVAEKIRAIVDAEDKNAPLSDEALAARLKERFGLEVSRKTVQEHRDRLQIPNSRARKRIAARKSGS